VAIVCRGSRQRRRRNHLAQARPASSAGVFRKPSTEQDRPRTVRQSPRAAKARTRRRSADPDPR
jgi:hypothetical protein